ncbi:hypothetical protein M422DRAFT_262628 [Sphaerobolus stellatus SS14]|uniref:Uncharacterized protein n=1 Tax=Sphaerobolus stellatus (strain SS14) TaxID=990650 RepID=A0A0C9VCJ1_SPHS4|nr:hypothetical protein M422DRAFT_262628 [Sphaerobolus stellatus SS14]
MFGSSPTRAHSVKCMKKDKSTNSQNHIRLNCKASITHIETVTEVHKVWVVPHDEVAHLLDLTGQEKLRKPDGEMRSIDSLIWAEDNESCEGGNTKVYGVFKDRDVPCQCL